MLSKISETNSLRKKIFKIIQNYKGFYCDAICKSVKNKDHERRKFKSSYIYLFYVPIYIFIQKFVFILL